MISSLIELKTQIKSKLPTMPPSPPSHEVARETLLQLSALICIATVVHFSIGNLVISAFALLVFALKSGAIWHNKKSPPNFIMALLLVFSIGMVVFFYGGWNGQVAGISFIVLLVALKFLESRSLRDYYVVCILLYFLASSWFLFNSSVLSIIGVILYTIAITGLLYKISTPSRIKLPFTLKESCKVIAKAIPLTIFLFFFFPRLHGSFGFLPSHDRSDSDGLKDSLVAGEMANGAFDTSLAFRVQFKGDIPPPNQLYWRSKVMPVERNFQWEVLDVSKRNMISALQKSKALDLTEGDVNYDILHEPSQDKFIPYLDYVAGTSRGKILDDYSILDGRPKGKLFIYKGSSTLTPTLPASLKLNKAQLLNTESRPTARLQALITQWRSQANNQQELIKLAYNHFSNNEFYYSLAPPLLDEFDPLDDFIFNSRTGYCEHYASAFTILMRWMDIPARIVVGYQGGKLNKAGNYLEVRYSDAHAWSEVWVDDQWQRVDPTAAVSPDRILFGMDALVELWDGNNFSNSSGKALSDILNPKGGARYLRQISDSWNNISYQWNKWVVNYDQDKQQALLANLGFKHKNSLLTLVGLVTAGVMGFMLFYFWQLIPKPVKLDELQKAYYIFTNKFTKHGVVRNAGDTPDDFRHKATIQFPDKKQQIDTIIDTYQLLRYGRTTDNAKEMISLFKQHTKEFKLS